MFAKAVGFADPAEGAPFWPTVLLAGCADDPPQNVAIQLASPAADPLGRAGVSGAVNNHFLERFGAAIMMTIIGGSMQVAANAAQNSAGNTYLEYMNSSTNQIANTTLQHTIDIPPTLTKHQGENVSIFVARDLNFSKVYKLSVVSP